MRQEVDRSRSATDVGDASGTGEPGRRTAPADPRATVRAAPSGCEAQGRRRQWTDHKSRSWSTSLHDALSDTVCVVVTHQAGMTVAEVTELRRQMRDGGASFKVTKNRLARLALEGTKFEQLSPLFTGPTAIAYSHGPGGGGEGGGRVRQAERQADHRRRGLGEHAARRGRGQGARRRCRRSTSCAASWSACCRPRRRGSPACCRRRPASSPASCGAYANKRRREARLSRRAEIHRQTFKPVGGITWLILQKLVDDLSKLTVIEAARAVEDARGEVGRLGRGAGRRRRPPAAAPPRPRRPPSRPSSTSILRGRGRQEDQRDQGSPRDHRPRPQGGQGPGRGRAEGRQGRRQQGRGGRSSRRSSRTPAPRSRSSRSLAISAPTVAHGAPPFAHGAVAAMRSRRPAFGVRRRICRMRSPDRVWLDLEALTAARLDRRGTTVRAR